ncbi:MAG: aminopeptidase P N-terminal domain-containing protein [Planctomycetota bacterium]|nr:aminopeptidase P N-terminal domain-containing protein [Planctomycetota bacterium]MDG2143995.1 aminopeptidase P N-terminal domain-containing protein [Planctomycetota bacterium]
MKTQITTAGLLSVFTLTSLAGLALQGDPEPPALMVPISSTTAPVDFFGPAVPYDVPAPTTKEATAKRRARLAAELGDDVLIISAGEDIEGRFHAGALFYWLTGVQVPDAVLVIRAVDGEVETERLYLPPKDLSHERWNGPRLAPNKEAIAQTGIASVGKLKDWRSDLTGTEESPGLLTKRSPYIAGEDVDEFIDSLERKSRSATNLLRALAAVREEAEIAAIGAAIDMTQQALAEAFAVVQPGAWEFEAEAAIESGYRKRGAFGPSFPSIVGSGPNSCYLHYRSNTRQFQAGDIVVMDVGARYKNYCADVTRTIPVSGDFTPRQLEVYTAVWDASVAGAATLKPGATIRDAHMAARGVLAERDMDQYFLHSVGHGLGLFVHDTPGNRGELKPGMVVTIEPGVYIAEEELGVRIENDWLITETGAICLSNELPSAPDELIAFLQETRAKAAQKVAPK